MSRSIRVAAVQLRAHARADFESTVDTIVATAASAAEHADLVVLPEGTLPAYVLERDDIDEAPIRSAVTRLQRLASSQRCVMVVGSVLREGSTLYNAALVIDADGGIAGHADKVFLWHFDRRWFAAGDRIQPLPTAIGTVGAMICADGRIPTIARELVDRGAEIIVMPTAWVTSGRNPHQLENVQADLLARVRARENGVPFVAANKCGVELSSVGYCGKSQIVDCLGNVAAIADQRRPEIIRAVVEVGNRPDRSAVPTPAHRPASDARPIRVAFALEDEKLDVRRAVRFLGADAVVLPKRGIADLDARVPSVAINGDELHDPGVLVAYRLAGYRVFVWTAGDAPAWTETFARARALELRMYGIVFDAAAERAFAVDPDGTVIAGTFDDYRLASFSLDPRRTAETTVAPETDVLEGLARAATAIRANNE
jgi:predicted amidohydrolase